MPGRRRLVFVFVALVVVAYLLFRAYAITYIRWEWFQNLGFLMVFWASIRARTETTVVAGVLFGGFLYLNLWLAAPSLRAMSAEHLPPPYGALLQNRRLADVIRWLSVGVGGLAGFAMGSAWQTFWFAKDAVPFGTTDPIFHRDVGDYLFRLPAWRMAYESAGTAFVLAGIAVVALYAFAGWFSFGDNRLYVHPRARGHLYGLFAAYMALKAVGYRLDLWSLLYGNRGFVVGVGYADAHVALPVLHVLMIGAAGVAVLAIVAATGRAAPFWWGLGALAACSVVLGTLAPAIVEDLAVRPSQLTRERPYIVNNITATRQAFGLDQIQLKPFPVTSDLTAQDLAPYQDTFNNIRLWDWQIASPAFQQLQGLRTYYQFDPVTIDRYTVDGHYRQVLLAAREMDYGRLPADTWINQHMKFTHGYGVVVVPASGVGAQGMPQFWMQDIDNKSSVGLQITQPRIYYGLGTTSYSIVGPQIQEFDYPQAQGDAYNEYDGTTGVPIGGLFGRLAFSFWANNYNALLSSSVGPGTRALIYRDINTRLRMILNQPFLTYDQDPYLVLAGGRLYWIVDGYTTSGAYPYATGLPSSGINYMRNAVKAVVDAYNGTVTYYVADPTDPIIRTEERIFPGAFKPLTDMPADLRAHLRYPEDFFSAQAQMYRTYHMTDASVFYNNEDPWSVAKEIAGGSTPTAVPPYYVILQFPDVSGPQFVLMEPFTPLGQQGQGRDNMSAWLAAFSDGPNYGHLVAYEFPKDQTVFGPLQVESQINQDSTVAEILTLWTQGGSSVSRGNLLVIPIRNSFLYVEPLYQTANSTNLPALRRVIVDYAGKQVAVGDTLDAALAQIFGPLPWATPGQTTPPTTAGPGLGTGLVTPGGSGNLAGLAAQAQQLYQAAEAALKNGDFSGYAQKIQALGGILQQMAGGSASGTAAAPSVTPAPGGSG